MVDFDKYEDMIESTIDLDQIKNHFYLIKSDFDPDLEGELQHIIKLRNRIFVF